MHPCLLRPLFVLLAIRHSIHVNFSGRYLYFVQVVQITSFTGPAFIYRFVVWQSRWLPGPFLGIKNASSAQRSQYLLFFDLLAKELKQQIIPADFHQCGFQTIGANFSDPNFAVGTVVTHHQAITTQAVSFPENANSVNLDSSEQASPCN